MPTYKDGALDIEADVPQENNTLSSKVFTQLLKIPDPSAFKSSLSEPIATVAATKSFSTLLYLSTLAAAIYFGYKSITATTSSSYIAYSNTIPDKSACQSLSPFTYSAMTLYGSVSTPVFPFNESFSLQFSSQDKIRSIPGTSSTIVLPRAYGSDSVVSPITGTIPIKKGKGCTIDSLISTYSILPILGDPSMLMAPDVCISTLKNTFTLSSSPDFCSTGVGFNASAPSLQSNGEFVNYYMWYCYIYVVFPKATPDSPKFLSNIEVQTSFADITLVEKGFLFLMSFNSFSKSSSLTASETQIVSHYALNSWADNTFTLAPCGYFLSGSPFYCTRQVSSTYSVILSQIYANTSAVYYALAIIFSLVLARFWGIAKGPRKTPTSVENPVINI